MRECVGKVGKQESMEYRRGNPFPRTEEAEEFSSILRISIVNSGNCSAGAARMQKLGWQATVVHNNKALDRPRLSRRGVGPRWPDS